MTAIQQKDYEVIYDPAQATVVCQGSFRLRGVEYEPILAVLDEAASAEHSTLTLDVRELCFLNSAGINTLYKFVLHQREQSGGQLVIKASARHPWQKKSLDNLQRILPSVQLELGG